MKLRASERNSFVVGSNPTQVNKYTYIVFTTEGLFAYLACVRFEPTTTEFRSDTLTDRAIRP